MFDVQLQRIRLLYDLASLQQNVTSHQYTHGFLRIGDGETEKRTLVEECVPMIGSRGN